MKMNPKTLRMLIVKYVTMEILLKKMKYLYAMDVILDIIWIAAEPRIYLKTIDIALTAKFKRKVKNKSVNIAQVKGVH